MSLPDHDRRPDLSIVVPVYRSEAGLEELATRIARVLDARELDWELILVDDGSPDGSAAVIETLASQRDNIIGLLLARNHGQHYANLCGIKAARGNLVVTMDDDLQNPPEALPKLLDAMVDGREIVIAAHDQPQQGGFRRLASNGMQWLLTVLLGKPKSLQITSFRCMTRTATDRIAAYEGVFPYLPALMFDAVPLRTIANLTLERAPRAHGKSSYTLRELVRLASFLVVNHSTVLLRGVLFTGLLLLVVAAVATLGVALAWGLSGSPPSGWTALSLLLTFLGGLIMTSLGIVGEYVGRILVQTDLRQSDPVYRTINR